LASNPDFRDLLSAFSGEGVEFLIVGAHAVMFYSEPRYTKDLDILVKPSPENARRVWNALIAFGAPLTDVVVDDFANPGVVYQIGVEPNRIDILTSIAGLDFDAAFRNKTQSAYEGVPIYLPSKEDLIAAKRASGRKQDLLDVERMEQA